jgi:hypothetical protein
MYVCQHYINILVECDGVQGVLRNLRSSKDVNLNDGEGDSPSQEKLTGSDSQDLESGHQPRKRKTSQNAHSHGSFFLRVGAIGEFMHVRGSSGFYYYHTFSNITISNDKSFSVIHCTTFPFVTLQAVLSLMPQVTFNSLNLSLLYNANSKHFALLSSLNKLDSDSIYSSPLCACKT